MNARLAFLVVADDHIHLITKLGSAGDFWPFNVVTRTTPAVESFCNRKSAEISRSCSSLIRVDFYVSFAILPPYHTATIASMRRRRCSVRDAPTTRAETKLS